MPQDFVIARGPLPRLTQAQARIMDYLISHPDNVAYMSSAELAQTLGVSNATVVRFSQHIGFKGYLDLQTQIRQEIKARLSVPQRVEKSLSQILETKDFLKTVFKSDQANLARAARTISPETFEQLAKEIHGRTEIWVLGLRSCHGAAHYFATTLRFLSRRVNLISLEAGTVWDQIQPGLNKESLLIAISFPRYCRQTLEICQAFHEKGARIAAITDSPASPLGVLSHLVFPLPFWIDSFFESHVAVMAFFNALLAGVSFLDGQRTHDQLERLEEIWEANKVYIKQPAAAQPSWADQLRNNHLG